MLPSQPVGFSVMHGGLLSQLLIWNICFGLLSQLLIWVVSMVILGWLSVHIPMHGYHSGYPACMALPAFHGHAGNISVNYSVYGYVESNGRH